MPGFQQGLDMGREMMDTMSEEGRSTLEDLIERPTRMSKKAEKLLKRMSSKTKVKAVAKKVKNIVEKALPKNIEKKLTKKQKVFKYNISKNLLITIYNVEA